MRAFAGIETSCLAYFLFEYVLRLVSAENRWWYVIKPLNILDLVATVPYFVELVVDAEEHRRSRSLGDLRMLRILRLLRAFRLIRVSSSSNLDVLYAAVVESLDMLAVLIFMLCIAIVAFSTFIFYAEEGKQTSNTPYSASTSQRIKSFDSIPDAFWWSIVTLMTVGYGDQVPITPAGKAVAGIAMVVSFVILALPISVIGANFTQQWLVVRKSAEQTASMEADFRKLHDELTVHNRVLLEFMDAVSAREAHMEEKGRRLQAVARSAGVELEGGPGFPRTASQGNFSGMGEDEAASSSPPLCDRKVTPRALLSELEEEAEVLLTELASDVQEVEETFALAELVTSEDFVSTCDAVLAKQIRLQAMERSGSDACQAVSQLLAKLAEDRAARPTMLATAARTRVPGLAEAAAEAAALLGLGKLAGGGLGGRKPSSVNVEGGGGMPRPARTASGGNLAGNSPGNSSLRTVQATLTALDGIMSMRFGLGGMGNLGGLGGRTMDSDGSVQGRRVPWRERGSAEQPPRSQQPPQGFFRMLISSPAQRIAKRRRGSGLVLPPADTHE